MFNKEFNHEKRNLQEACGFDDEKYFTTIAYAISKLYSNSIKNSFFVEAVEKQILGNEDVPNHIRRGLRVLALLAIPQIKLVNKVIAIDISEMRKELESMSAGELEEIMEEAISKLKEDI